MIMKRMSWILFGSLVFAGCSSQNDEAKRSFTHLGKPIHPSCIETLYNSEEKPVDLKTFKTDVPFKKWEDRPGWLITEPKKDIDSGRISFFAYKFLAGFKDRLLLMATYSGGGTGTFDNVLIIQKTGEELRLLKTLGEGDRCNGGIAEDRMDGNNFYYSRNLTPVDILRLATEVKIDVTAYEDLEASAMSCFGVASYRYNIAEDKNELISVSLNEEKQDEEGWTDKYRAQSCFNKIYNSYVKAKKTELSLADLNEFAKKFRDECLKKASSALY